jgi:hypothetical protein
MQFDTQRRSRTTASDEQSFVATVTANGVDAGADGVLVEV